MPAATCFVTSVLGKKYVLCLLICVLFIAFCVCKTLTQGARCLYNDLRLHFTVTFTFISAFKIQGEY